ncbi:glycoside hydrolase family 3 protein [Nonomuraea sp. PA05]|uniref:glycoside hydrolase family 3 protein n=1 Tax=Nonomuraea sp. PA05 TaxID=2604466 RepID=UPI0011DB52CF|nr:glycoside hydrolase family 3 protein [Nonomuraea sp. PA05]TYB58654.1 glycoside hydrolase family 3 protein [Nonomuraea sp. PA05]
MSQSDRGLRRLAAGTLLVAFQGTTAPEWVLRELEHGLGGVTLFGFNVADPGQVLALTTALRGAGEPVISLDEEGGDVTRLAYHVGSPYPGNAALGAVDDVELTRRVYRAIGSELAACGINLDMAPSADVNTEADNPVIGTRSFGTEPALVARHTVAAVEGLQSVNVAACVKHFPGHGATRVDSHLAVPVVDVGLDVLRERELAPFRAAIGAGAKSVMTAHVAVPAVTGQTPATLSGAALTGLLRGELGYDGVVVTDALDMQAITKSVGLAGGAVLTLAAGADLLCLGPLPTYDDVRAIITEIVAAVREGRLPESRLEEAAARVAALRSWAAAPEQVTPEQVTADRNGAGQNGTGQNGSGQPGVGLHAARRAVRLSGAASPLVEPLVVEVDTPPTIAVGDVPWGVGPWLPDAEIVRVKPAAADVAGLLAKADGRSLVVVVKDAHRHDESRSLVSALVSARPDTTVIEMGLPVWRPDSAAYIATYGAARANAQAAVELLTA